MKNIPIRDITSFSIRDIKELDMVQALHRHDFYYMLALKKGKGEHAIDFISYEVADNMVFFLRPGQVHQLTMKAGSTGYLMSFKNDFYYSPLLRKASLYHTGTQQLFSILTAILREYTDKQEAYQKVIQANLDIFFIELMRQHSQSATNNTYAQERLEEFLELLETQITHHKQVSQYADMLHLSPYQLNAITKATLGKTCSTLINEHIILEAKRYLLATADQVNQIAWHLGYIDVSYFIRLFKKHTGHSPEAFRHHFSKVL
ncbi:helix-turn-helix domain-containing protein [Chitinophaga sp. SYP-B3965]|uniref:AraC family transcriptional regulator n=1 Tax=Chitinophaga sp. SYP-B3965 TaxID=2663120 RepID=UPI00129A090B|nr:helix-turn-helix domain-containing protein [Chitinophaga sp. SYP-B3965]MRG45140.1 helix-turn-helix domain-containing protein [Chitinophaga sp. SYP-B3965]